MLHALEPYGADRTAFLVDGAVSLGSHLLRTLPEDQADCQPLRLKSHKGWLIADARVDNRDALATALSLDPEIMRHLADSSVLLEAWERWGEDAVDHLVGAFTFAVWQPEEQRLYLARDHAGERPLYYTKNNDFFAFASMPKGILALPGVPAALDEDSLACFLAILPFAEGKTLFGNLQSVPHGHCLTVTPEGIKLRQYWHPSNVRPLRLKTDPEYLEAFRECFDEAVRCRLRTTGAIGSELSGGLDSSSVTATAAGLLANSGRGLTAFTHVPRRGYATPAIEGRFGDEGPFAADVAALYSNIEHVLVPNGQVEIMKSVSRHVELDDQPVFNPTNAVWTDAILDEARSRGVTAMLTGRAGNGTISYDGYLSLADMFRSGHWLSLAATVQALRRNGFTTLRKVGGVTVLPLLPLWLQKKLAPRIGEFDLEYCAVNPDLAERINLVERARIAFNLDAYDVRSDLNGLFVGSDFGNDNAGFRAGWRLEMRDPTADKRVFEFIHSIPIDQFVRDGWMRSLIRRAMKHRLPESTLRRHVRGLQAADWHESMSDSLANIRTELRLLERSPLSSSVLDLPRMKKLTDTWPTEGFHTPTVQYSYHYALSRGIGMGAFVRRHDPDFRPE
jgi:asparagine synthase (glutamine-hydrolysing)